MGIVSTNITLRNPLKNQNPVEMEAKVDTGSILLVIPGEIARQFEFPAIRTELVKYANEQIAERTIVGAVQIEICGRTGWFEAIVEPSKSYALIGAVVMESLDLVVEPRSRAIYPNPRSELPMTEIG